MPTAHTTPHHPKFTWGNARSTLAMVLAAAYIALYALAAVGPASAADQVIDLKPTAMAYVDSYSPTKNFATATDLVVSSSRYRTYLTYDTSGISTEAKIIAAELQVLVESTAATQPQLEVRTSGDAWAPSTLIYNEQPSTGPVINPDDTGVPVAGKTLTTALTAGSFTPQKKISLRLSYSLASSETRLSKTTAPILRLTVRTPTATVAPVAAPVPEVPYKPAPIKSTAKKVFAHYFPPYPISIDNRAPSLDYYTRHYLNPDGESGKYKAVGGLLRDRPEPRAVLSGDYQLADAMTEVQQASANGVDGFMVNLMGWSGASWTRSVLMTKAAAQVGNGFVTMPNLDMTSTAGAATIPEMAAGLAKFYADPGTYRLADGRYALGIFRAEAKPASFYGQLQDTLKSDYGISIAWIGIFLSLSDAQVADYAPIAYGMGTWGVRSAAPTLSFPNRAAFVQKYGLKWMSPIAVQDARHRTLSFAEAGNTDLIRASWSKAIADGADMVQLITWNDYSESTQFAPSWRHGEVFMDINGYYVAQFKTGRETVLTKDELIVTHRIQSTTLQPRLQTAPMDPTLSGSKAAPRNTVEVMAMLTAPATVSLSVGGTVTKFDAPAGVTTYTVPLSVGSVSASATRAGATIATVTSPYKVVSSIDYWDLQYYAASSRENP